MDITKEDVKLAATKVAATKVADIIAQDGVKIVNEVASISLNRDDTVSITISKEQFSGFIADNFDTERKGFDICLLARLCPPHKIIIDCPKRWVDYGCVIHGKIDFRIINDLIDKGCFDKSYLTIEQAAEIQKFRL